MLVRGAFGLPDEKVTEFALVRLRSRGRAARTISASVRAVGEALDHLRARGICLEERIAKGTYLSHEELQAFATSCKRGRKKRSVHRDHAANKYSRFLDYVAWLAAPVIARASSEAAFAKAQRDLKRFQVRASAVAPPSEAAIQSPDSAGGLTPDLRDLLLQVIRPESERNPWADAALRSRNYAMVMLAYELGPRAGDVLSLKVRDLSLNRRPATVTFHRRHDDPEDPRADQPTLKTKPRVLEISDRLALSIETWLDKFRADRVRFPDARRHPFVFVNNRGNPISQRGFQLVYERLREAFPEFGRLVSHSLRHDWNERWVDLAEKESYDPWGTQRQQCYAMGWSERSNMPARYARRAIAEAANRRISRMNDASENRGNRSQGSGGAE